MRELLPGGARLPHRRNGIKVFKEIDFEWIVSLNPEPGALEAYFESMQLHRNDLTNWYPHGDEFIECLRSFVMKWEAEDTSGNCCAFASFYGKPPYMELESVLTQLPENLYLIIIARDFEPLEVDRVHVIGAPSSSMGEFSAKVGGHVSRFLRLRAEGSLMNPIHREFDFSLQEVEGLDQWEPHVSGRRQVKIVERGVQFDFLSILASTSTSLLVIGQSAIGRSPERPLPVFQRWTWAEDFLGGSVLVLNDPLLYRDHSLGAGWWFGLRDRDLAKEFVTVVAKAADALGVGPENVYFYGGSAGGFSSMQMASCLAGSRAIADIPQLDMRAYHDSHAANAACEVAFGLDNMDDLPSSLIYRVDVIERFIREQRVPEFLLLQNARDTSHLESQFATFLSRLSSLQAASEWACTPYEVEVYSAWSMVRGGHFPLNRADTMGAINAYVERCEARRVNPVR